MMKRILAFVPRSLKRSPITHNSQGMFKDIPDQVEVMRYHSLIAEPTSIPDCLEVTATVGSEEEHEIMGIQHQQYPIYAFSCHHNRDFKTPHIHFNF